jgi:hypothetical protein
LYLQDEVSTTLQVEPEMDTVLYRLLEPLPRETLGQPEDSSKEYDQCSDYESEFPA